MAEITTVEVKAFLQNIEGREISLDALRRELQIEQGSKSWDGIRNIMFHLVEQKVVKPSGRKNGIYKVLRKVDPIRVFGSNHKSSEFKLYFPRDFDTGIEIEIAEHIVVRGGDLILIAGVSNYGKTALAMNFLAENISSHPVLMGNEYTTADGKVTPRFLNRINSMEGIDWVDEDGNDNFTLMPVLEDYAEYIVKDRINIIDWINIETGEHYMIGSLLKSIKQEVGDGVAIAVIQKAEGAVAGRGGQFTKDFADVELLIEKYGERESRLTVGKVKEYTRNIIGRSWAYEIVGGVKLINIREIRRCKRCYGKGYNSKGACEDCNEKGWVDK